MFDNFIYKLCDKIVTICEKVKTRIKNTSHKKWVKGYNEWRNKYK